MVTGTISLVQRGSTFRVSLQYRYDAHTDALTGLFPHCKSDTVWPPWSIRLQKFTLWSGTVYTHMVAHHIKRVTYVHRNLGFMSNLQLSQLYKMATLMPWQVHITCQLYINTKVSKSIKQWQKRQNEQPLVHFQGVEEADVWYIGRLLANQKRTVWSWHVTLLTLV